LNEQASVYDFHGTHLHLTAAFCNPKPIQRPHPPIPYRRTLGPVLRVVAEHADLWNILGGDIDDAIRRSALLARYCAEIGRDPASVTRSIYLPISYDQHSITQDAIGKAIGASFQHIVLGLPAPYLATSHSGSPTSSSPSRPSTPAAAGISASRFRGRRDQCAAATSVFGSDFGRAARCDDT
jgi:alkanesulfonate monooxygenase SsuD/methylene tetrahydromethanopterin reductase-like flavin-dependent oxidoreductase (luciferase family)